MSRVARIVGLLIGVAIIASCALVTGDDGADDPAADLRGSWSITENPNGVTPHDALVFTTDNEYRILNADDQVFERGPMREVTSSGFEYTIEQADHEPDLVGSENYAEYSIEGDELTITFYDDDTKQTEFVSFVAVRE
jgi:hypothetical protein